MFELEQLICTFFKRGVIRFDLAEGFEFTRHHTPEAPRSPLYFNLRTTDKGGPLQHEDVTAVTRFFCDAIEKQKLSVLGIAPVLNAGLPFAIELREQLYHRPKNLSLSILLFEKDTGKLRKHPSLPPGNPILLLDDVVTDGTSKAKPITGIRQSGYRVEHCLVFVKRSNKSVGFLRNLGVKLHWVTTSEEVLSALQRNQLISGEERERAIERIALL